MGIRPQQVPMIGAILLAAATLLVLAAGQVQGLGPLWTMALALALLLPVAAGGVSWAVAGILPLLTVPWLHTSMDLVWPALAGTFGVLLVTICWRPRPQPALTHELLEAGTLAAHLGRYPQLVDACLELASAREIDQLAACLIEATLGAVPQARRIEVHLGEPGRLRLAGRFPLASASGTHQTPAATMGLDELVAYVGEEARFVVLRQDGPEGRQVVVAIPLRGDRRGGREGPGLRGVLILSFAGQGLADVLILDLLKALGRLGGLALASVALIGDAQALAYHDDLTGLYGRLEFLSRLSEQAASVRRGAGSLGLIMCDMDHLKDFNDRWGHAAGDEALRRVANAIRSTIGTRGLACRYGGEEFVVILPDVTSGQLAVMAEALRAAIAAVPPVEEPEARVTASLGHGLLQSGEAPEALLQRVDAACYRAKSGGRNRVEAA